MTTEIFFWSCHYSEGGCFNFQLSLSLVFCLAGSLAVVFCLAGFLVVENTMNDFFLVSRFSDSGGGGSGCVWV